jgi:hypothetical protein
MSRETPLQAVKRRYGSKEKLVDSVVDAAKAAAEDIGSAKERLLAVSNRKLLRLAVVNQAIKDKYGNRDKLVIALGQALGKAKDKEYLEKLKGLSSARLLDMVRSAEKRVRRAAASPKRSRG